MVLVCQKSNRFFTRRLREYSRYFRSIVRYGTKIVNRETVFLAPRRNLPRFDIDSVAAASTSSVRLMLAVSSSVPYLTDSAREGEWTRHARGGEARETICRFNVANDLCRSLHVPSDSVGCICTLFRDDAYQNQAQCKGSRGRRGSRAGIHCGDYWSLISGRSLYSSRTEREPIKESTSALLFLPFSPWSRYHVVAWIISIASFRASLSEEMAEMRSC